MPSSKIKEESDKFHTLLRNKDSDIKQFTHLRSSINSTSEINLISPKLNRSTLVGGAESQTKTPNKLSVVKFRHLQPLRINNKEIVLVQNTKPFLGQNVSRIIKRK